MSRLLPLFLALLWAAGPALGQKLKDKTRPANDAVQCPYTGGDAELLAAIGIQAVGGFPFSIHPSTKDLDEYFGDDLTIWLETEHFRLGYGLGPYKVGGDERNELRAELTARAADGRRQVKMVTLVNPGNPTGVMIPRATIEAFSELC